MLKPKKLSGNFARVPSPHTRDLPRTDSYSSLSLCFLPFVPCYTPGYRVQTGLFLLYPLMHGYGCKCPSCKKGGGKRNLIIREDLIRCMGYVDLYQFISTTVYILTSNLHINTLNHVYIKLFGLWCRSPKVFINNIHVHVHLHFAYRTVLVLDIFAMTFGSLSI